MMLKKVRPGRRSLLVRVAEFLVEADAISADITRIR
jgi:hypothetical protein